MLNFIRHCKRCVHTIVPLPYVAVSGNLSPHTSRFSTSSAPFANIKENVEFHGFHCDFIRNFGIIAHVDHGKSTLADRLLEMTGTIQVSSNNKQVLDSLQVERERGITVKAQGASLVHHFGNQQYLLNLIDTPGHVDFNYEVSRSLAACQGVVLLVDANEGIQAQTVANFYLAFEANLAIIPVINKIDLKGAQSEKVAQQLERVFDFRPQDILRISAKEGTGVAALLDAIVTQVPSAPGDLELPFRAQILDSTYDHHRGVCSNLAVLDGSICPGDRIISVHQQKQFEVSAVGVFSPTPVPTTMLKAGQVGFVFANIKKTSDVLMGDTVHKLGEAVEPLPGFKRCKPMVYGGFFPMDKTAFLSLKSAVAKLLLSDGSVELNTDSSAILGQGFRLGFLGLLHMDVFSQRLDQEFDAPVIMTSPNVPYRVKLTGVKNIKFYGTDEMIILNPAHLPPPDAIDSYEEPMVVGKIITPAEFISQIQSLIYDRRGEMLDQSYIDNTRILYKVRFPLNEIIIDFFDELKSLSSGYASFDYEDDGFRSSQLIKVDFYLNGLLVDELSQLCHISKARSLAHKICLRLKETLPQQNFVIPIQGKINSKVLARENIRALRKDVTAKCYGGDVTRRMKLLNKQKEGKKKMKMIGKVEVPRAAFLEVVKRL